MNSTPPPEGARASVTVALDANGGDAGVAVTVPAAMEALRQDAGLSIILVGPRETLEKALPGDAGSFNSRLTISHAPDALPMDARPAAVLRRGQTSSMWQALQMVSEGKAAACVSGGSTAALMTLGVKLIGLLEGIQRPALMAYVPGPTGHTGMLDLGANLQVSARQLVQFAVMGSVTAQLTAGIDQPRVGLLNVGHEESKGIDVVREAHNELKTLPLNYVGFIEGNDIFTGAADVAVCDGFVGNLILKSCEGLARLVFAQVRTALDTSWPSRLGALLAKPALRSGLAHLDPSAHNGAPLLGLRSVVIKSHGGADVKGMTQAILEAARGARRQVPNTIKESILAFHLEKEACSIPE